MKIRDSGMPDQPVWEGFFNARDILRQLGFDEAPRDVVDFGCGYGTFSVAAAALSSGTVHALDIEPDMVAATATRAAALGLSKVVTRQRDFVAEGTGLADQSVDYAMLFNVLHASDPMRLLHEAHRILRPGGRVAVIHWIHDAATPRGPSLRIRPRPRQCQAWLRQTGFELAIPDVALPPYHYGLLGRKSERVERG